MAADSLDGRYDFENGVATAVPRFKTSVSEPLLGMLSAAT